MLFGNFGDMIKKINERNLAQTLAASQLNFCGHEGIETAFMYELGDGITQSRHS